MTITFEYILEDEVIVDVEAEVGTETRGNVTSPPYATHISVKVQGTDLEVDNISDEDHAEIHQLIMDEYELEQL